jgi:hypothetical protein
MFISIREEKEKEVSFCFFSHLINDQCPIERKKERAREKRWMRKKKESTIIHK